MIIEGLGQATKSHCTDHFAHLYILIPAFPSYVGIVTSWPTYGHQLRQKLDDIEHTYIFTLLFKMNNEV